MKQTVTWFARPLRIATAVALTIPAQLSFAQTGTDIAAPPSVNACDRLAAHTDDRGATQPGVLFDDLRVPEALAACGEAVDLWPDEPRLAFQLGRVLTAAGRYHEARAAYERAARQDYAAALAGLAHLFHRGLGVEPDAAAAARLYRRAAELGDARAQNNLGMMYRNGDGVAQDLAEALALFRRSASQNDATGLVNLGQFYADGIVVARDEAEAVRLYRAAASQGRAVGQVALAGMLLAGRGTARDIETAVHLLRQAAGGSTRAQAALHRLCDHGVESACAADAEDAAPGIRR